MQKPNLISVIVATYNHEKYIRQCLDGILMQQGSFLLEILVWDDCSADNSFKIIREYEQKHPHIIRAGITNQNIGLIKNFIQLIEKCSGKYIAPCSGDDYWKDPEKLLKQFNFLESNPDFGIVHTDIDALFEKSKKTIPSFHKHQKRKFNTISSFQEMLNQGCFSMITAMFKKQLIDEYISAIKPQSKNWSSEDYPFFIYSSINSKIHYFPESTAVYRIRKGSIFHSETLSKHADFLRNNMYIEVFFAEKYHLGIQNKNLASRIFHNKNLYISFLQSSPSRSKISLIYLKNNNLLSFNNRIYHFMSICKPAKTLFLLIRKIRNSFSKTL